MGGGRASTTAVLRAPLQRCVDTIMDFEAYPEWQAGVKSINVLERDEKSALVDITIDVKIKKVSYTLRYHLDGPSRIWWEYAGRALAELAIDAFRPRTVVVLAGSGGNGGGGLVAARHMVNRGREVRVVLAGSEEDLAPVPARQLDILHRMATTVSAPGAAEFAGADLIIDALLGYSLAGSPRDPAATLIRSAKASETPTLSQRMGLDVGPLFTDDSIVLLDG